MTRSSQVLPVTSITASSRFDAVSSGPKSRKLRCGWLSRITSASIPPSTRVGSDVFAPGDSTGTA
jgi:hypothetical protein